MTDTLSLPITYMITSGEIVAANYLEKSTELIRQIRAAVDAGISLIQIREKQLDTNRLFTLVRRAVTVTRGTGTKLLVNDRTDVAVSAGADGVHLTAHSIPAEVIRRSFGRDLLIAVSTHTKAEAVAADEGGVDLIVFGPVFETPGKGAPKGLKLLSEVCRSVSVPVLGLGGIDLTNFRSVIAAGSAGFSGIRCFANANALAAELDVQIKS